MTPTATPAARTCAERPEIFLLSRDSRHSAFACRVHYAAAGPARETLPWPVRDHPGPAREQDWAYLAGRYDTNLRFEHARKQVHDLGLRRGDPDGEDMLAFLVSRHASIATISDRGRDLGRYHALATREDVAPFLAAYRPWQWVIATAVRAVQAGESYDRVKRDLLAEIAERRQEAASS